MRGFNRCAPLVERDGEAPDQPLEAPIDVGLEGEPARRFEGDESVKN